MREYNRSEGLLSLHVPKTGGTSFRRVLRKWFKNRCLFFYPERNIGDLGHQLLPNGCVHGHFNRQLGFGLESIFTANQQMITFLRDPVEQHKSLYRFKMQMLQSGVSSWDWKAKGVPRGIDHFFEEYEPTALLHLPTGLTANSYKRVISENFIHIGVLEQKEESMKIIAEKLGEKYLPLPHLNKGLYRDLQPSKKSVQKFCDQNDLLLQLYSFAYSLNS